jgi:hypothetical protein
MTALEKDTIGLAVQHVQRAATDTQSRSTQWDGATLLLSNPG